MTKIMRDSDQETADNARLDRRLFLLDDSDYERFVARLDTPVVPSDALKKLLADSAPWER